MRQFSDEELKELFEEAKYFDTKKSVRALERLSRFAKESSDFDLAGKIYYKLVETSFMLETIDGTGLKPFMIGFGSLRNLYERAPSAVNVSQLFACYIFTSFSFSSHLQLSRSSLLGLLEEMKKLATVRGATPSMTLFIDAMAYYGLGEIETATAISQEFEETEPSSADRPCRGCMNEYLIPFRLWHQPDEFAISIAEKFNADRDICTKSCSVKAEIEYPLLSPLARVGRTDEARKIYRKRKESILYGYVSIIEASEALRYLSLANSNGMDDGVFEQGIKILETYAEQTTKPESARKLFDFYSAAALFCRESPKKHKTRNIRLTNFFLNKTKISDCTLFELENWFKQQSVSLAEKFDKRNQNDFYGSMIH